MITIAQKTSTDLITEDSKKLISYSKLIINQIRGKYSNILGLDLINHYHLVWKIFKKRAKSEEDDYQTFERYIRFFSNVFINTKLFIQYFFPSVFVLMITLYFIDIHITHVINLLLIPNLIILFGTLFFLRQSKLHQLQINETHFKKFLTFIHPGENKSNFIFFTSIDLNDNFYLEMLYEHFLNKSNIGGTPQILTKEIHDTTIKLVALDFLFYSSGGLETLIGKLIGNAEKNLTKDGIYIFLSKILGTNKTNIEKNIRYNLPKFHNAKFPTRDKIAQLEMVRGFFVDAKMTMLVRDIDNAVEKISSQIAEK